MFLYGWLLHTLEALINAALVFAALTFVAQMVFQMNLASSIVLTSH